MRGLCGAFQRSCGEREPPIKVSSAVLKILQIYEFTASPTVKPDVCKLDFSSTYLGGPTLEALLPVLEACGPPGTLCFRGCGLNGPAVHALMAMLGTQRTVHTVDLSDNKIGTEEAHAVLNATRSNPSLLRVELEGTRIVPFLVRKIQTQLHLNGGGSPEPAALPAPFGLKRGETPPPVDDPALRIARTPTDFTEVEAPPALPLWTNICVNQMKYVLHERRKCMHLVSKVFDIPTTQHPATRNRSGRMPLVQYRKMWAALAPELDGMLAGKDKAGFEQALEAAKKVKLNDIAQPSPEGLAVLDRAAHVNHVLDQRLSALLAHFGLVQGGLVLYEEALQVLRPHVQVLVISTTKWLEMEETCASIFAQQRQVREAQSPRGAGRDGGGQVAIAPHILAGGYAKPTTDGQMQTSQPAAYQPPPCVLLDPFEQALVDAVYDSREALVERFAEVDWDVSGRVPLHIFCQAVSELRAVCPTGILTSQQKKNAVASVLHQLDPYLRPDVPFPYGEFLDQLYVSNTPPYQRWFKTPCEMRTAHGCPQVIQADAHEAAQRAAQRREYDRVKATMYYLQTAKAHPAAKGRPALGELTPSPAPATE